MATLEQELQRLIGEKLESVTFVHDYVQLGWARSGLNAYTMPVAVTPSGIYMVGAPEYRQVLYRLEGRIVTKVDVPDECVRLLFEGGTSLSISLRDEDYSCPEALLYQEKGGSTWVV
jgi:hypothetical protein